MCFEYGSIDRNTSPCIICSAIGNPKACPHQSGFRVCQDRRHPQAIVHLTNVDHSTFEGCGYCKWLKSFPNHKGENKGWPGCCRKPEPLEYDLIPEQDWPIVAKYFGIPNPYASSKSRSGSVRSTMPSKRGSIDMPVKDDKEAYRSRGSASPTVRGSPSITEVPIKGSPRFDHLEDFPSRAANGTPPRHHIDPAHSGSAAAAAFHHRQASAAASSPSRSGSSSPQNRSRRSEDKEASYHASRSTPRSGPSPVNGHSSTPSSSVPARLTPEPSPPSPQPTVVPQPVARVATLRGKKESPLQTSTSDDSASEGEYRRRLAAISKDFQYMNISSGASNRDSMTTVMSDGGFTDYLSEESEAEMQRQAEEKAAEIRRLRIEEAEFNSAKRALANVTVRNPAEFTTRIIPARAQPYNPSAYAHR